MVAYPRIMTPVARQGRQIRRPQHRFQLRHRPWQIQPMLIAPVLPGETLRNLLLQARCVTDPIANPLVGWWLEYYFMYVKHRDLSIRDDLTEMMLDPDKDLSSHYSSADAATYHFGGTIDWTRLCLERIVEEYFRDEGEPVDIAALDDIPMASISQDNWLDSAVNAADYSTPEDIDVDLDADSTIMASEIDRAMRQYSFLQAHGLVDTTYEDYLRTYGVRVPEEADPHKPELIRYIRDWSYPTNHVDPSNGAPSSAVSWAVAERADKDRFFSEPGFVVGCTIARPKVYLKAQAGSCVGVMVGARAWLPAIYHGDPRLGFVHLADGTGPLPDNADEAGYWFDLKDLLIYGDQFLNFDISADATASGVALPLTTLQRRYASSGDANALFTGEANKIKQDGVVSLMIAGRQRDTSPRTPVLSA